MAARMTYAEQLKHPLWQRRRLEILNRADFKCEACYGGEKTLHVHHKRYRKGAMAWDYSDQELVALCEDCHEAETLARDHLEDAIAGLGIGQLDALIGFAEAIAAVDLVFDSPPGPRPEKTWPVISDDYMRGFFVSMTTHIPRELMKLLLERFPQFDESDVHCLYREGAELMQDFRLRAAAPKTEAH